MNDELDPGIADALRDDPQRRKLERDQAFVDRVLSRWESDRSAPRHDDIVAVLRPHSPWRVPGLVAAVAALVAAAIGVGIFAHASRKPPRQPDPVALLMRDFRTQLDVQPQRARHAMNQVKTMLDVTQLLQVIDALPEAPDPAELVEPEPL